MSRHPRRNGPRAWWLAALAAGLGACASVPNPAEPIQYLDRNTAVTFTLVAQPMVFAHARPQVAARVRDYATVAAGSMDRNGRMGYVLIIYFWSTVDPRYEPTGSGLAPDLVLAAEDRRIALEPLSDPRQALPPVDRPPAGHWAGAIYPTDLATLRYLTAVRHLWLLRRRGGEEARFDLWEDERACLAALVRSAQ